MAKKSAIVGEYIVTVDDSKIYVSRIYKSTMAALKEVAEANGIDVKSTWTTQHLGRLLLTQFCNGATAGTIGEYEIQRDPNNRINVIRTYTNSSQGLREAANVAGFTPGSDAVSWTQIGHAIALVDFVNSQKK